MRSIWRNALIALGALTLLSVGGVACDDDGSDTTDSAVSTLADSGTTVSQADVPAVAGEVSANTQSDGGPLNPGSESDAVGTIPQPNRGCGDGICDPSITETCTTCRQDCGECSEGGCGDGTCNPMMAESCESCPADCGMCIDGCGDGMCSPMMGESCESCPADCGQCPQWGWSP